MMIVSWEEGLLLSSAEESRKSQANSSQLKSFPKSAQPHPQTAAEAEFKISVEFEYPSTIKIYDFCAEADRF
jgi:hypothetical protein